MFKKITDERIMEKNLKMFRTLYLVQTAGIIIVLLLHVIEHGFFELTSTPVWYVFIITTIVYAYLQMDISVDNEENDKAPSKYSYGIGFIISLVIAAIIAFVVLADNPMLVKLLAMALLFIATFTPFAFVLFLKNKKAKDLHDE
ncbi:MAG: hypothetical protein LRY73_17105 [Bacillus sp. (in: Bacteria)]|nr:hypothetical protein [Bacillus sp. (in: firmicutes)]